MSISQNGYNAIQEMTTLREGIMQQVAEVAQGSSLDGDGNVVNTIDFSEVAHLTGLNPDSVTEIDITGGPGAMILDDVLQAMSTVEQSAAQLVAAENKSQQAVNSLTKS